MKDALKDRKIILGITGGIAAYKSCTLCRMLVKNGANVYVVMTEAATKMVGIATFEALSGHHVSIGVFDEAEDISHIALARDADLIIIAPATANTIAKIRAGIADNMLTASILAAVCPIVVAPSMNVNMYRNAATQDNINTLEKRGIYVIRPVSGALACGVSGDGRLPEPEDIFDYICSILGNKISYTPQMMIEHQDDNNCIGLGAKLLSSTAGTGFKVVITAGPTEEPLDPVRYLTNRSSGKMGFALAKAAKAAGADVTLIAGPVNLPTPLGVNRIDVRTANEMLDAAATLATQSDIFIGCAAVADFRSMEIAEQKISKRDEENTLTVRLIKNPDIISAIGHLETDRPFTVGFAAETIDGEESAVRKLNKKHLDLIVLNDVSNPQIGFNSDLNEVTVFDKMGKLAHFDIQPKRAIAIALMELIFKGAFLYKQEQF